MKQIDLLIELILETELKEAQENTNNAIKEMFK